MWSVCQQAGRGDDQAVREGRDNLEYWAPVAGPSGRYVVDREWSNSLNRLVRQSFVTNLVADAVRYPLGVLTTKFMLKLVSG